MNVVSNTSPITNLAAIGQLDLLKQLYGHIIIPQAVYNEIVVDGAEEPGAQEVQSFNWIEKRPVENQVLCTSLQIELDLGESEAITCAVDIQADILLLDERKARKIAYRLGIPNIGLLGILVNAKRKRIIPKVKPLLDELIYKAGFWVKKELHHQVLKVVGE